ELGEGIDVPGRQAVAGDKQRGRAGQPPLPQGATERLLGADGGAHPPADRPGHAPRAAFGGPDADHEIPAPSPCGTVKVVYYGATVSNYAWFLHQTGKPKDDTLRWIADLGERGSVPHRETFW